MSDSDYWLSDDEDLPGWDGPPVSYVRAKLNAALGLAMATLWMGWLIAGLALYNIVYWFWDILKAATGLGGAPQTFKWTKSGLGDD